MEASVHKALGRLKLEVLPGAHQGRVVDQGVEELPAPAGPLGARHFGLLLLLLDQLDPWGDESDTAIAPAVCSSCRYSARGVEQPIFQVAIGGCFFEDQLWKE